MPAQKPPPSLTHRSLPILLLRLGLGWLFFYAGYSKVITYFTSAPDWTATGFLERINGPLASFFQPMIGSPIIDYLNAYGLLLIGLSLTLGILVRWASLWGITLMILYWLADFPPFQAFIIDDHLVYALCFLVLATADAGRTWGLDALLEHTGFIKRHPWLKLTLG